MSAHVVAQIPESVRQRLTRRERNVAPKSVHAEPFGLTRATDLQTRQLNGLLEFRAAAARKRDLRRTLRRAHLAHLRRVARMAERDLPELHQRFVMGRGTIPYRIQSLAQSLDEFDQAVGRGIEGRRAPRRVGERQQRRRDTKVGGGLKAISY